MLADMAAGVEACRLVNQKACWQVDNGQSNTYLASIAKMMSGMVANKNAEDALQVGYQVGYHRGIELFVLCQK